MVEFRGDGEVCQATPRVVTRLALVAFANLFRDIIWLVCILLNHFLISSMHYWLRYER